MNTRWCGALAFAAILHSVICVAAWSETASTDPPMGAQTTVPASSTPTAFPAGGPQPADTVLALAGTHPSLWNRAVEAFEANKDLVPGKVLQKVQEVDDKGRVKSQTDIEISLALGSNGTIKSEIVKATKDGEDITAAERKKAAERERKEEDRRAKASREASEDDSGEHTLSYSLRDSPFNPERQEVVRVAESPTRETVAGVSCARFDFSYPENARADSSGSAKDELAVVKGTAWIDERAGRPLKVEFTTDPLPKHAKSMRTTLRYGADTSGPWVVRQMTFEAHGAFLFFSKRIRAEATLGDYWKHEAGG